MRIRKNAKISPLAYVDSSLLLNKPNECELNQSPWDVVNFSLSDPNAPAHPSSLFQVVRDDSYAGNGSFGDSIKAAERMEPMNQSSVDKKKARRDINNAPKQRKSLEAANDAAEPTVGDSDKTAEPSRPARVKKTTLSDTYYYYTEFAAEYGRKRSQRSRRRRIPDLNIPLVGDVEEELEPVAEPSLSLSSCRHEEEAGERGTKRARKLSKARSLKSLS